MMAAAAPPIGFPVMTPPMIPQMSWEIWVQLSSIRVERPSLIDAFDIAKRPPSLPRLDETPRRSASLRSRLKPRGG